MDDKKKPVANQCAAAPRARPMPKAERRRQLLEVARDIIEKDGISALTMSAITERSGASRPIVYEHFKNSEAVAIALLEAHIEGSMNYLIERLKHVETLEEYTSISVDAFFEYNIKNRLVMKSIAHGYVSGSRPNEVYARHQKVTVGSYIELLLHLGASREVAEVAGYGLHEMAHSCIEEFATQPNNSIARETLKRMISGVIRSVVPETSRLEPQFASKILKYIKLRSKRGSLSERD